jgi:hypothetical protein
VKIEKSENSENFLKFVIFRISNKEPSTIVAHVTDLDEEYLSTPKQLDWKFANSKKISKNSKKIEIWIFAKMKNPATDHPLKITTLKLDLSQKTLEILLEEIPSKKFQNKLCGYVNGVEIKRIIDVVQISDKDFLILTILGKKSEKSENSGKVKNSDWLSDTTNIKFYQYRVSLYTPQTVETTTQQNSRTCQIFYLTEGKTQFFMLADLEKFKRSSFRVFDIQKAEQVVVLTHAING